MHFPYDTILLHTISNVFKHVIMYKNIQIFVLRKRFFFSLHEIHNFILSRQISEFLKMIIFLLSQIDFER